MLCVYLSGLLPGLSWSRTLMPRKLMQLDFPAQLQNHSGLVINFWRTPVVISNKTKCNNTMDRAHPIASNSIDSIR